MKNINIIYILAILAIIWLLPFFKEKLTHSVEFFGIAENPVRSINFDYPVEILALYKKQGETLESGDTIMTLRRLDLRLKESSIQYELAENDSKLHSTLEALSQDLVLLENQKSQVESEYRYDAEVLKQRLHKFQTSEGYLIKLDSGAIHPTSFSTEARQQETKYKQDIADLNVKQRQKQNNKSTAFESHRLKQAKLNAELELLRQSSGELTVVSPGDGMVGLMEFGEGDRIPEFTSITKLYDQHPHIVSFYIGDQQLTLLNEGDSIWVESLNNTELRFKGIITSMGNRITSLPERLKKIPELKAWGREVQIRIPIDNPFLQGEKVKVYF